LLLVETNEKNIDLIELKFFICPQKLEKLGLLIEVT